MDDNGIILSDPDFDELDTEMSILLDESTVSLGIAMQGVQEYNENIYKKEEKRRGSDLFRNPGQYYIPVKIYRGETGFILDPGTLYLRRGFQTLVKFKALNVNVTLELPRSVFSMSRTTKTSTYVIRPGHSLRVILHPDANLELGSRFPYRAKCTDAHGKGDAVGHSAPDIIIENDDNDWP